MSISNPEDQTQNIPVHQNPPLSFELTPDRIEPPAAPVELVALQPPTAYPPTAMPQMIAQQRERMRQVASTTGLWYDNGQPVPEHLAESFRMERDQETAKEADEVLFTDPRTGEQIDPEANARAAASLRGEPAQAPVAAVEPPREEVEFAVDQVRVPAGTSAPVAVQFSQTPIQDHLETNASLPPAKTCLTPGCDGKVRSRGLCQACYNAARLRVNSEVATWEELEKAGLALPSKKKSQKAGNSSEVFDAAFDVAMRKQEDQKSIDYNLQESLASVAASAPPRVVEDFATGEELREAALAVANNPCQQNLDGLAAVQARLRPISIPGRVYVSTPTDGPNPYAEEQLHQTPSTSDGYDSTTTMQLPEGMTWARNAQNQVYPRTKTKEELIVEDRKAGKLKSRELRLRSREDSRIDKTHEIMEDLGDLDDTGMSDEEFDRIKKAYMIRTGQAAQPPAAIPSAAERRKPTPTFANPPDPISENTPIDPALEGGGKSVYSLQQSDVDEAISASDAAAEFVPPENIIQE